MKVTGSWCAFNSSSSVSSTMRFPGRPPPRWRRRPAAAPGSAPAGHANRRRSSPARQAGTISDPGLRRHGSAVHGKLAASQDRMLMKHLDQPPGKGQELAPWPIQRPVHPGQLVVLAIGVAVTPLGPPEFVAGEQHRHAPRGITWPGSCAAAGPGGQNGRIVCGSFHAAIPAQVLVGAVLVALAVGRVMLLVVTDQVMQREAVAVT